MKIRLFHTAAVSLVSISMMITLPVSARDTSSFSSLRQVTSPEQLNLDSSPTHSGVTSGDLRSGTSIGVTGNNPPARSAWYTVECTSESSFLSQSTNSLERALEWSRSCNEKEPGSSFAVMSVEELAPAMK